MHRTDRVEEMRQRCGVFLSPAFARFRVAPLAGENGECAAEIVRTHGTRVTLRFSFSSGTTVYAKTHRGGAGRKRFDSLRALWQAGFNGAGGLLVPEPLGFLEDENMVLMREARGTPLSRVGECSLAAAIARMRAAARWLSGLHATPLAHLGQESACGRLKILEESDLLAEAAAACPDRAGALLEFLGYVRELAQTLVPQPAVTPTHGQFIPSTIFIDEDAVTVIDLDTLTQSDPAKDVASLISRVKYRKLFNGRVEPTRAGKLASEFLHEYSATGRGNLANLPYYLALYCLREFAKFVMDAAADRDARDRAERLCRWELRRCLRERSEQLGPNTDTRKEPGLGSGPAAGRGVSIAEMFEGQRAEAVQACRLAARRLLALHHSGIRVRKPEREWMSLRLFCIVRALIVACAESREHSRHLIETLYHVKHCAESLTPAGSLVPMHGSFSPQRVFIAGSEAVVIEPAHSVAADPAKDVAEFVSNLQAGAFDGKYDRQLAEQGSEAFLEEYLSASPVNLRANIDGHTACYLALRLLNSMTANAVAHPSWQQRSECYRAAIAAVCNKD